MNDKFCESNTAKREQSHDADPTEDGKEDCYLLKVGSEEVQPLEKETFMSTDLQVASKKRKLKHNGKQDIYCDFIPESVAALKRVLPVAKYLFSDYRFQRTPSSLRQLHFYASTKAAWIKA